MRPDPIADALAVWVRELDGVCVPTWRRILAGTVPGAPTLSAIAKRARRAAKRAEDERRTAAGRAPLWVRLRPRRAFWDWCEWRIRNGEWHVRNGSAIGEPRWRIRSRERRALSSYRQLRLPKEAK